MAKRRMLSRSISTSKRLAALKNDGYRLLFTWMIPHMDDFGRMEGDPFTIRHDVIPTLEHDERWVTEALMNMGLIGLIHWFRVGERIIVEDPRFDEHQTGLHKRTKSNYPGYEEGSELEDFTDLAPQEVFFKEIPGLTESSR